MWTCSGGNPLCVTRQRPPNSPCHIHCDQPQQLLFDVRRTQNLFNKDHSPLGEYVPLDFAWHLTWSLSLSKRVLLVAAHTTSTS